MILFVVNPVSGGIDKDEFMNELKQICQSREISIEILTTSGKNDLKRIQEKIEEVHPHTVVAVGGDGTVSLVARKLAGTQIKLGILPYGSANGFASELDQETDVHAAMEKIIADRQHRDLDLLEINGEYKVLHFADFGINASIINQYHEEGDRGVLAYAKHFIQCTSDQEPFRFQLDTIEGTHNHEALLVGLCNGRKFGTGIPLTRYGRPDDGEMEVVVIEKVNLPIILQAGAASLNDIFFNEDVRKIYRGRHFKFIFEEPQLLQIDGEIIKEFKEIEVKVQKGVIKLIDTSDK